MKYKYLVIDSSNLFWRCCADFIKEMLENPKSEKIYSVAIQNVFDRIKDLIERFGYTDVTKVYLCFDNADSVTDWRKEISNMMYKSGRDKRNTPPAFYDTLNLFEELCKYYSDNYYIAKVSCAYLEDDVNPLHIEADDLTPIVKKHIGELKQLERILFISADLDWARNIDKQSDWFNFYTIYNIESFYKKHGFRANSNQIKMYKAIHGDRSDSIQNAVPGLRKEILFNIVQQFNSPKTLYEGLWKQDYPKNWKIKIQEAKQQVLLNYKLVDFADLSFLTMDDVIFECKENKKILRKWWDMFNLNLENRMIDKEKDPPFSRKKHKIVKINRPI